MSRRTRRTRRRLHRRDGRGEPLTLLVDDRYPGETLEALVRAIYRYRSELAPLALGAATGLTAAVLHAWEPGWAPVVALLALAGSAVLWWVARLTPGLRRIERAYAATVTGAAGLWLAAATAVGPGTTPLPALLTLGTLAAAVPWWWHRRRRARVRVERTLQAWPDIADAVGLTGSRVMSAVVDLWGWRARIGLRRGQTAADVIAKMPALESGLGIRPGAVRVEPDPARADHCLIRVLDTDPHARAIAWPGTSETVLPTITAPIPLGLFEDASLVTVNLAYRHALIGGVAGAGKSGVLNVILATLTICPDVVLWGIDLKGGMELRPWAPCLDRLATTPAQATDLLTDAVTILDVRAARLSTAGQRLWRPSPAEPALVVIIDEYAELSDDAPTAVNHADSIARRGRAVALTLLVATQRPTQKAMGSGAVRSQMDIRVCLRVRERRDVDLVLGQGMLAAGWHAHTLDAPGKFLLSTPEHPVPRRARAYLLTDTDVTTLTTRHTPIRPTLDRASREVADPASALAADSQQPDRTRPRHSPEAGPGMPRTAPEFHQTALQGPARGDGPETALWAALASAGPEGIPVAALLALTTMTRPTLYRHLQVHAKSGRVVQVARGYWRAVGPPDGTSGNGRPSSPRIGPPKRSGTRPRRDAGRPPGRDGQ